MHRITISNAAGRAGYGVKKRIRRAVSAALSCEGVSLPCEVNVLLADNDAIRRLNSAFRGIDRVTDVLSFPSLALEVGEKPAETEPDGFCHLGDIVISLDKVRAQAKEYGHSEKREITYLTVHSTLHLLGYDHVDEAAGKAAMRAREEAIMGKLV